MVVTSVEMTFLWILLMVCVLNSSGAKSDYPQVPDSSIAPLLVELNFYRNDSHLIKARLEAEKMAATQRASGAQIRLEVKHQMVVMDNIIKQIKVLQTKKRNLEFNTSRLGKILLFRQLY